MITKRDKEILRWIEKYKSITINQCCKLFFINNKCAYDQARKRLRYLNKEGFLKRYRKNAKSEVVYYMQKKLSIHDLKIMDVIIDIMSEFNITEILIQHKFSIDWATNFIVDATVIIDNRIPVLIEIDYTHYTSIVKIERLINYLEKRHKRTYIFLIVNISKNKIEEKWVGMYSKVIYAPWNYRMPLISRSLRSLVDKAKC